jgi:hypothetical protein
MSLLRAFGVLRVVPVLLAISCTGQIGDAGKSGNGGPGGTGTTGGGTTGGGTTGGGTTGGGTTGGGTTTGGNPMGPLVSAPGVTSRFVRLNHQQWENSVKDVLKLTAPLGLSSTFVAEPLRSTFDTNGTLLSVGPDLWQDYQSAAEAVAQKVVKDAALLARLTPTAADKATAFVKDFGLRAFRRPLTDAEVTRYVALFNKGAMLVGSGNAVTDGIQMTISAFFQSPNFLYRTELGTQAVNGRVALNGYEVASKLSYAITNTMPDDALLGAATGTQLTTRDGVLDQATRLLATATAEQTVANFHDQLLRMRNLDTIAKDTKTYPLFNTGVAADLKQEGLSFVNSVIFDQDRGFTDIMTAPYTFANSRVRQMYGLPAAGTANTFVKTDLDPAQRAGILTQIGFLASHGQQATPSIIMRGVHIAKDLLCVDIPPPPDMVPPLPALMPGQTNRQRVEKLTANAPCSSCHPVFINPLGFAFEKLDAVGAWRPTDNGQAIDAKSSYQLDGQMVSYDGAVQLAQAIAQSQQGHACYARRWAEYLYGRDVDPGNQADADLVANAGAISRTNPSARNLILNLVTTESFVTRLP